MLKSYQTFRLRSQHLGLLPGIYASRALATAEAEKLDKPEGWVIVVPEALYSVAALPLDESLPEPEPTNAVDQLFVSSGEGTVG
jgi:hypothetical protein